MDDKKINLLIPSKDEFIKNLEMKEKSKDVNYILPNLKKLHRIVHEILPKPNKGLWEPGLKLDPFLLTYFTLQYEKELQIVNEKKIQNNKKPSKISSIEFLDELEEDLL